MKDLVAKLRIEAEATGEAKIAVMARELEQLAAQGTAAAPAFAELANELRALQAEKGDALGSVSAEIDAVLNAATSAAPAVGGLSNALEGVAQPEGLGATAGQVGALGTAATGAAPAVDGLSSALAGVAQPDGLVGTAGQVGSLGKAATGAAPAVDVLSTALEGVAQPEGLAATAGQVGTLGNAAASAAPAVDGLSSAIAGVSQPAGLGDTAGQLGAVGRAASTAEPAVGALEQQMNELGSSTADSADALGEMGSAATDARGGVDELAEGAAEAADAVNQLSGAQPQLEGLAQAIAAIFALAQLKQAAGSAIELADAFGQMDERVRMATAGTAEYEAVQARLLETANNTFRPLAEQQELYIRTADALRSLGLSTEQAVDVTDAFSYLLTTNAASADRAKSAIDAYSKSLAAGKVDVDAWMSITTAMPTVVDAIATSMSKSAAEVRKLGVEGALSLAAINTALLQTRDASEQTASTMDATLNDAVQRLQNNWGRYLADLNASYGVTEKLVGGLVILSENLEAVGKAAAATGFVALVAAITAAEIKMYGYIVALKAYIGTAAGAAAATTALTVALGNLAAGTWAWAIYKNAEALEEYRERAVAADLATLNMALNQSRLSARFADISASTGVVVTNMAELNAAVEEGRLHFDQATSSWRAGATSMSAVAEATQHLSTGAQALVEDYYKLRDAGKNTADALKGAFKGITNPEDFRGIQAMGEALAELGNTGEVSARQVDEAWRTALANLSGADLAKFATTASQVFGDSATEAAALTSALRATAEQLGKMSGTELQQFGAIARKAFEDGRLEAEAFAKINDQVLTASFERLGVSATLALGKISPAAQEAIDSVDGIVVALASAKVSAEQSALAIEMALTKAFASADTKEALGELVDRMEALDKAGKIGAEAFGRLANAAAEALTRIEDLTPGIQSVEEAFRKLGIKSSDELKFLAAEAKQAFNVIRESGKATPAELKAAFTAYAEAAIEANGGVADATLLAQAASVGLRVEADETGKTVVRTLQESRQAAIDLANATDEAAGGMGDIADAADEASKQMQGMGNSAANATDQASKRFTLAANKTYGYARGVSDAARAMNMIVEAHNARVLAIQSEERALQNLTREQERLNSGAARGVDDLKLRLIELNGTEEEIAQARYRRDEADMQRQIALMNIEIKRAARRGEDVSVLKEEIALMKEQLVWLDKIFKEEEKQRREREREAEKEEKRRDREQRDRERERNKPSDDSDSDSSPTPSRPSSNAGGGNLGGNGGTAPTRPVPPTGPIVNVHIGGVLDVQDHATLDSLARKLRPVFANLDRKGF